MESYFNFHSVVIAHENSFSIQTLKMYEQSNNTKELSTKESHKMFIEWML